MKGKHYFIALLSLTACIWFAIKNKPVSADDLARQETLFKGNLSAIWNEAFRTIFDESVIQNPEKFLIGQQKAEVLSTLKRLNTPQSLEKKSLIEKVTIQRAAWALFDSLIATSIHSSEENQEFLSELAKLISATALSGEQIHRLKSNYSTVAINDVAGQKQNPANDINLQEDIFKKKGDWIQVVYKDLGRMAITHEEIRHLRSEYIMLLKFPEGRQSGIDFIENKNAYFSWNSNHKFEPLPSTIKNPIVPSGTISVVIERMMVVNDKGEVQATPLVKSVEINELVTPKDVVKISRVDRFILGSRWKNAVFKVSLPQLLEKEASRTLKRLKGKEPFSGVMNLPNGLQNCKNCHNHSHFISFDGGGLMTSHLLKENMLINVVENGSHSKAASWKEKRIEFQKLKTLLQ